MTQLKGQWWHPAAKGREVSGILSVDSDDGPSLELIGALAASGSPQEWPDSAGWVTPALHGRAEGKHVTLFGAYATSTHNTISATYSVEQKISSMDGVLVGGKRHVAGVDDPIFRAMEVELDYLTFWSGLVSINWDRINNESGPSQTRIDSTDTDAIEANTADWTFQIEKHPGIPTVTQYLGVTKATLPEVCVLRIISRTDTSAKSFLSPARIFRNLLTHAIRKPSSIRSMTLYEKEERGHGAAYVWHRADIQPASNDPLDGLIDLQTLFTANQIDFPEVVKQWFEIASQLGTTLDVLMGLDYGPHSFYENKLLNAATVIEAAHREFFPESVSRDPELHKNLKQLMRDAIPRVNRNILSAFRNDPGYIQRCTELASIPDEVAVTELLGDVRQWSKWIRNARNDLAHLNPEEDRDVPDDVWYWLAPVTTSFLHLVLMGKLGISSDLQRRSVKKPGAFEPSSHGFREASKEHL